MSTTRAPRLFRRLILPSAFCLLPFLGGCTVLGFAASQLPAPTIPARYVLADQTVGVMVWAERGILLDWSSRIQQDLARSVQRTKRSSASTTAIRPGTLRPPGCPTAGARSLVHGERAKGRTGRASWLGSIRPR